MTKEAILEALETRLAEAKKADAERLAEHKAEKQRRIDAALAELDAPVKLTAKQRKDPKAIRKAIDAKRRALRDHWYVADAICPSAAAPRVQNMIDKVTADKRASWALTADLDTILFPTTDARVC